MALIHNNNLSVYAGVSKQAVDLRLPGYCEEMINCYPTVQYGVQRRGPTSVVKVDSFLQSDGFAYSYDRGLSSVSSEQYYITIDAVNGLKVFDLISKTYSTVTLTGSAASYIVNASGYANGFSAITIKDTTIITNRNKIPTMSGAVVLASNRYKYDHIAYIWIKQVSIDPAFPYTFSVSLRETNGTVISSTTSAATTTTGVALAIATWANALADFTAASDGSVVEITRDSGLTYDIVVADTYGSQASSYFKGVAPTMEDLPKAFPFKNAIVKIDGTTKSSNVAYWVKYDGNKWVEHRDESVNNVIDAALMPHKLIRNPDFTFTLAPITWNNMKVGDYSTQAIPEFVGSPILDLFFINGRLGLLTSNGISMSQQGVFFNFFRSTVLALLDDSTITTFIDSSISVGLCWAIELQGVVILFGDKSQFYIDSSKAMTPATISINPVSKYEINRKIKPFSLNDSAYFVVNKSEHSALYEMNRNTLTTSVKAIDISSHVTGYIDGNIKYMAGMQRNNMLFLLSATNKNTVFVYRFHEDGKELLQSAWSKWVLNMDIESIFSLDNKIYASGKRYTTTVPNDEYPLSLTWKDLRFWGDTTSWLDGSISSTNNIEAIDIEINNINKVFLDNGNIKYNSSIELSEWSMSFSANNQKELRGNLLIKTIDVSSEPLSKFNLVITDKERNTSRTIPAIYTVDRKPFVSGNAKNMNIKIASETSNGFQIKSISLEGQYNVRSKRV